jgi:glycerol-3-phosphate dehydrogenase
MHDAAVIGGGVVGTAVALALARRGADTVLLEAEPELGLQASGTNSGILHTGFHSPPEELETQLILRSLELRDEVIDALGIPVLRCGATMRGGAPLAAHTNGVAVTTDEDGDLHIPGETITDPVAYTRSLAAAAAACGAEIRTNARVESIARTPGGLELGDGIRARTAVNAAGLHADEVARAAGDDSFEIYPRKGEFFVFDASLDRILLPVPTERTRGVLVFPTIDGKVVAGPTAHDQLDKHDWSVRPEAWDEITAKARELLPGLEEPIASYAGLRPAGRGVNYLIERSRACPPLVHAAAIRSTGLSASLGIAEYVVGLLDLELPEPRPLPQIAPPHLDRPWWRRT